jgi:hypothetical protein
VDTGRYDKNRTAFGSGYEEIGETPLAAIRSGRDIDPARLLDTAGQDREIDFLQVH